MNSTDLITQMKAIVKKLILNINYIFSSPFKLCLISLMILFSLFLVIIFIPIRYALGLVIFIGAILPSSIVCISVDFNYRKSTLYKNQSLNKNKKVNHYISSLLTFYLSTYIITFIIFFSLLLLQELDLLLYNWRKLPTDDNAYTLLKINYLGFLYSIFELSTTMYLTLAVFSTITKKEGAMYIALLTLVILSIIYGGVFNNYFSKARGPVADQIPYSGYRMPYYDTNAMLDKLFYPCIIIFPFFAPMQHLAWFKWSISSEYDSFKIYFFVWEHSNWYPNETFNLFSSAMHWNILWIMPYVHSCAALVIITIFNKTRFKEVINH